MVLITIYTVALLYVVSIIKCEEFEASEQNIYSSGHCVVMTRRVNITEPNCEVKTVDANYCQGQCITGLIPMADGSIRASCSLCQPTKKSFKPVTLTCKDGTIKEKAIEIYTECKCIKKVCPMELFSAKMSMDALPVKDTKNDDTKNHPCRNICRSCRRAKRKFDKLSRNKDKINYLKFSCRTVACKQRITSKTIEKTRRKRKLMKTHCRNCSSCKRKRKMSNE